MLTWISGLLEQASELAGSSLPPGLLRVLRQLLRECDQLYLAAAQHYAFEFPSGDVKKYEALMRDLCRGALLKTLIEIAHCDRRWTAPEKELAKIVLQHVWNARVDGNALARSLQHVVDHAEKLQWEDLVKPFVETPALHEEAASLRSVLLRLANLIAKADNEITAVELNQLEHLKRQFNQVFKRKRPAKNPRPAKGPIANASQAATVIRSSDPLQKAEPANHQEAATNEAEPEEPLSAAERAQMFEEAKKELESLIGLDSIKGDIERLVNFLKVQQFRSQHDLPANEISLHAVFEGNPGTGKTTVARIMSRLLSGLEILARGQTVEVDRSGLVAQYAGQTGPRTNERIDEAMGGVLFIDEAYSLMSDQGEDTYGTEAVQTLLKRMEDCRDQFVVVLAGYPAPMKRMLRSNPGLSSRIQKIYRFEDYSALDLLKIYQLSCQKYHYRLPRATQRKLLNGFQKLIDVKDEHFGNGRLARNQFESSITNMSSRIVGVTPLTREVLTTIEPEDVVFDEIHKATRP